MARQHLHIFVLTVLVVAPGVVVEAAVVVLEVYTSKKHDSNLQRS